MIKTKILYQSKLLKPSLFPYYFGYSKKLERIVESITYGTTSLGSHLFAMLNLAINDSYNKRLKITKRIISLSVSNREELDTINDVEMYSITDRDTP